MKDSLARYLRNCEFHLPPSSFRLHPSFMLRTRTFTPPGAHPTSSAVRRAQRLSGMPEAQRILGIDPGLHRTGYGLVQCGGQDGSRGLRTVAVGHDAVSLVEAGVLRAKANDEFPKRLQTLYDGLREVLQEHRPDIVVIEDLFSTYAHPRSALLMAHARGVLMLAAQQFNVPVHSFTPNEVKQVVTGNGHASKTTVQSAVRARLRLSAPIHPPDVADALAIAICFALRQDLAGKLE
jgi:crossover junction endodeoxyribonuclease RuvC